MMVLRAAVDSALVLVLLLDLWLLAATRLKTCIHVFALQCALLAGLPVAVALVHGEAPSGHQVQISLATLVLKVGVIPRVLFGAIRRADIAPQVEPLIGFATSLLLGAALIVGCFGMSARLPLPVVAPSPYLVPVALSTVLIGLLTLVTRVKAITQVIGYLVLENGVFLLGLLLVRQMPLVVELGVLLDVFVGVFVMTIVVHHIGRTFEHVDTHRLDVEAEP
jgi:hydrogenase-4 component E